jgi:C_GCAxxG_C_C family probable redox protein
MNRADSAAESMAAGKVNCAQAVLTAFCEELGLDRNLALKMAQGFGGGMGRSGETCGAVTGAYMVLGLRYSRDNSPESKEKMYQIIKDFAQKFKQKNRSILCKQLLGYDVSKQEELAIIKDKGLFAKLCPDFVRSSVEILEKESY